MIQGIDFIHICGWMRDLHLTDKQEKLYALIWNVSKSGHGYFFGTAKYIGEWIGCKERHAKNIIRQLEDMGLIQHKVIRTVKKTQTFFWAITPEEASAPTKGSKQKITWSDRALHCPTDRALECPTEDIVIYPNSSNKNKSCGGKNKRAQARNSTTTTTGFLFENDESGLTPGLDLAQLSLPYEQTWFVDAVKLLLQQPAWTSKSAAAVQIVLDDLGALHDDMAATYICRLAVRREWDDISNARKIADDDAEKISAYAGEVYAHQEGAIA